MLAKIDAQAARLLKHRLEQITPIRKLVVYGSRARGEGTRDSDLDVFIESPELMPELRRKISEVAWSVGFEKDVVITTFVASTDAIQNSPLVADPILISIARKGIQV